MSFFNVLTEESKGRLATRQEGPRKSISCRTGNGNRGGIMMRPSACSNHSPSPFAASWPWSPKHSIPLLLCFAAYGYLDRPFRPGVPGSGRPQPAPGAHWRRKPSVEPGFVALLARCIAPHFRLDENGAMPRNRCIESKVDRKTKGVCMNFFNVLTGESEWKLARRCSLCGRRHE